jgi:hypothetical protein
MPPAAVSATELIESIRKKSADCKKKITFLAAQEFREENPHKKGKIGGAVARLHRGVWSL